VQGGEKAMISTGGTSGVGGAAGMTPKYTNSVLDLIEDSNAQEGNEIGRLKMVSGGNIDVDAFKDTSFVQSTGKDDFGGFALNKSSIDVTVNSLPDKDQQDRSKTTGLV
jgi:hypothetical protein